MESASGCDPQTNYDARQITITEAGLVGVAIGESASVCRTDVVGENRNCTDVNWKTVGGADILKCPETILPDRRIHVFVSPHVQFGQRSFRRLSIEVWN